MRFIRFALLLFALAFSLVLGAHTAGAQGGTATLSGRVIQADGTPVSGATITGLSTASETSEVLATTTTGADGSWTMQVPAGREVWPHFNTFDVWWGYSYNPPFTLAAGASATGVDFVLAPRAVATNVPPTAVPTAVPATAVPTSTPVPAPAPGMPSTGMNQSFVWIWLAFVGFIGIMVGMVLRWRREARKEE